MEKKLKIEIVQKPVPAGLAEELEAFERQFTYPLGSGERFYVSHGSDYSRFFRAIGGALSASFIAIEGIKVLGTLGAAVRPARLPDGTTLSAVYFGDLKALPGAGRARTLYRLFAEANRWSRANGALFAYGIVMDGTARLPETYSGKCGFPAFRPLGKLCVLRLAIGKGKGTCDPDYHVEKALPESWTLNGSAITPFGGEAALRSESAPIFLVAPDGAACGTMEDTRRAKRLIREDGSEMVCLHLSNFHYSSVSAGAELIRQAMARAIAPALFVSLPEEDRGAFLHLLRDAGDIVQAPATIYGAELDLFDQRWNVSTSEI